MRFQVSMLFVMLFYAFMASAFAAGNQPDPEKVALVEAGELGHANAAWWGFDAEDATDVLQAAIDSGVANLTVPYMGSPWIVRPLKLRDNLELVFEPGVVLEAKRGAFKGKGDSLFTAADNQNIILRGYGAVLRMHKEDYQSDAYEAAEWRMCLDFMGCTNVQVIGLRLESSGGDGIYLGCTEKQPWCENVRIQHVTCDNHHRQGISVIGAVNLLIDNCILSNTGGTAPEAGIDFEPNKAREKLVNCTVRNCVIRGNSGAGVLIYLKNLTRDSEPVSIRVEDCHIRGNHDAGIALGRWKDDGPEGNIAFQNCIIEDSGKAGAYIYDKAADQGGLFFINCHWKNAWAEAKPGHKGPRSPVLLNQTGGGYAETQGGIQFQQCHVYDTEKRPVLIAEHQKGSVPVKDLAGTIFVHNLHGAELDTGGAEVRLELVAVKE
jgi:hypothetical protein